MSKAYNKKKKHGSLSWGETLKHNIKVKAMRNEFRVNIFGICDPSEVGILGQALSGSISQARGVLCHIYAPQTVEGLSNWATQYIDEKGVVVKSDTDRTCIGDVVDHLLDLAQLCPSLNIKVTLSDDEPKELKSSKIYKDFSDIIYDAHAYDIQDKPEPKKYLAIKTIWLKDQKVEMLSPEQTYLDWFTEEELVKRESEQLFKAASNKIDKQRYFSDDAEKLAKYYYPKVSEEQKQDWKYKEIFQYKRRK